MGHSKFGWSYPPVCSGPPDDRFVDPSELVESVLGLLEDAGVPEETNDAIVALIEKWEQEESDRVDEAQNDAEHSGASHD